MATLAELVVRLSGDSSRLVAEMTKGEGSVKQFSRESESRLSRVASVAKTAMVGFGAAVVGGGVALGTMGFKFNAMQEQATLAFTTMLGDGQKAKAFLDDLQQFAARTPFEFPELVQSAQKLLAMGFAAEQVMPTLSAIGDAVAGLGGGGELIDQVTRALGQMQAKGKASGEEMLQLTEAGIPAWTFLAKAIGTDTAGAMAKVSKGAVDAEAVINAVTAGMQEKFGGLMQAQSQTFSGLISTIKDNAQIAAGEITGPLFGSVTNGLKDISTAMSSAGFQEFTDDLTAGVATATEAVKLLGDVVTAVPVEGVQFIAFLGAGAIALKALPAVALGARAGVVGLTTSIQQASVATRAWTVDTQQWMTIAGQSAGMYGRMQMAMSRMQPLMVGVAAGTAVLGANSSNAAVSVAGMAASGALLGNMILPGWGAAIGGVAGATVGLIKASRDTSDEIRRMTDEINAWMRAQEAIGNQVSRTDAFLVQAKDVAADYGDALSIAMAKFEAGTLKAASAQVVGRVTAKDYSDEVKALGESMKESGASTEGLLMVHRSLQPALQAAFAEATDLGPALDSLADAYHQTEAEALGATRGIDLAAEAAREGAKDVNTLAQEILDLNPKIMATTLAAQLMAAGIRQGGGEYRAFIAGITQQVAEAYAQVAELEGIANDIIRGAGGMPGGSSGGGGGGGGGGRTSGSANMTRELASAEKELLASRKGVFDQISRIQDDFLHEQIEAFLQGGQAQVDVVKLQQDDMLESAKEIAQQLRKTFGMDLPDALTIAMEHVRQSAQTMQAGVEEAARAVQRAIGSNAKAALEQFGVEGVQAGGFGFNYQGSGFGIGGVASSLQGAVDAVVRSYSSRGVTLTDGQLVGIVSELERQQAGRFGNITGMATGGVVMPRAGGTIVRAAEAGVPELFMPMKPGMGLGGTSVTVVQHIQGSVVSERDLARGAVSAVREALEGGGFGDLIEVRS